MPTMKSKNMADTSSTTVSFGEQINHIDSRHEEAWHRSLDNLAKSYRDTCAVSSELQDRAGYSARMKHIVFGLPAPIIATVVTCISGLWDSTEAKYVVAPLSALGGIFAAVHTFFDMSAKAEKHWTHAARYNGLKNKIDATLSRDINFRIPPDAFFAEVRTELNNLDSSAPQLGGKGRCGCSKYKTPPPLPPATQAGTFHYEFKE